MSRLGFGVLVWYGLVAGNGFAAPPVLTPGNIANSPYVELYKLRVEQAELNYRRQQALADLAVARLERGKKLIAQATMSQEDYDTVVAEATATAADAMLANKKIDEAKAYLKIIEALVKRGVNIPLCTYEME